MNYLRKKNIELIFVFAIIALFSYSLFANSIIQGHDTLYHMNRIQGVVNAFQDHQLLPAVYPYSNNGYGYASPLFYCDLAVYPFAVLYWLGVPLVVVYKMMLGFYGALSVISIFYVTRCMFSKKAYAPYLATILYTFCNYHLYDQYLRQAFGEVLALAIIPLVLLSIHEVLVEHRDSWIKLGISFSLLLLSHLLSFALYSTLFAIFVIFFLFINRNDKRMIVKAFITTVKAVILALGLTAFHLLPMLEQMNDQVFNANLYSKTYDIMKSTLSFEMMLYPLCDIANIEFGGYFAFNIGLVYLFMPLVYLYLIFTGKGDIRVSTCFVVAYTCVLLSMGLFPFMAKFSILNVLQFSYRFNLVAFPLLTFVIVYSLEFLNIKIGSILAIAVLFYSLTNCFLIQNDQLSICGEHVYHIYNNQKHSELFDPSLVDNYHDYNSLELSAAEYLPPTESTNYLTESLEIKTTDGDSYCEVFVDDGCLPYERLGTKISFTYSFDKDEIVMLPLTYYKGYAAYADGSKLELINLEKYKKVAFKSVSGEHTYTCCYEGTITQRMSMGVSIISLCCLLALKNKCYLNDN